MRLFFFLLVAVPAFSKPLEMQIETPHAILINAKTGAILYEKNARMEVFPASTTKIASILYILKTIPNQLDVVVKATPTALKMTSEQAKKSNGFTEPAYWLEPDGTSANLVVGEEMSVKDLLFGAMLASGNDACNVLAEYIHKDVPTFMEKLNEMVKELGCQETNFMNPHGLYHPLHKTSAYEMAMITREALKIPFFQEIVATEIHKRSKTNKQNEGEFINANALIRKGSAHYYSKALGIKTGRTKLAKFNLIAAAKDGDRELIAVLHKSPNSKQRFCDAIQMFETAFAEKMAERLLYAYGDTSFVLALPKAASKLIAEINRDVVYRYYPSEEEELQTELTWLPLSLPIMKGAQVAEIRVKGREGRIVLTEPLFAAQTVHKIWVHRILEELHAMLIPIVLPLVLCIILLMGLKQLKKRQEVV